MPERTSYEPGTPNWVDLETSDTDAAAQFYGGLFGWEAKDGAFVQAGKRIAGVGAAKDEAPNAWTTYVSTDDVEALTARAKEAGAHVIVEPRDLDGDAGRAVLFMHPACGVIGAWQPGERFGAELVNDPFSFSWSELATRDVDASKAFGEAVFGWGAEGRDFGGMDYTVIQVGETGVGGIVPMPADVPEAFPSYWLSYFAVEDCDATVAKAGELGGTVAVEPMEIEGVGRFAVLADPQGAIFGVIRNAPAA